MALVCLRFRISLNVCKRFGRVSPNSFICLTPLDKYNVFGRYLSDIGKTYF